MNYSKLVDKYISGSGLSLGEIVSQMKLQKGVKIDRSYISKLRNNPKYPASDDINRALAEITGGDPDKLVYAAYIEKAPEELKEKLLLFQEGFGGSVYPLFLAYTKYLKESISEKDIPLVEFFKESDSYINSDSSDELGLLILMTKDSKNRDIDLGKVIDSAKEIAESMEFKKKLDNFVEDAMLPLVLEEDKFHPLFEKDIILIANKYQIPPELMLKPNNLKSFMTEDFSKYEGLSILGLLYFLASAAWKYQTLAYEIPGFNNNVKIELDKWLSDGEIVYKEIPLTSNDKLLISMYIDAVLKDKIDKLNNSKENETNG